MDNLDTRKFYPSPKRTLEAGEIAVRATAAYEGLRERFEAKGTPVNFDFRRHCVAWTARGDHYTHRLHRYPGRLTPYIPLFFLSVSGIAVTGGRLLDPFAGCGTVLVEAPVHPAHPMQPVGLEINPLARLIAKVKTTQLAERAVMEAWLRIRQRYNADRSRAGLPNFPNKRHWFSEPVERRLARVLRALEGLRDQNLRDFFLVATSSVVRDVSMADPSVAVPVKIDPSRFIDGAVRRRARKSLDERADADVISRLERTVAINLLRLRAWADAKPLPGAIGSASKPTILGADARTFATSEYLGNGILGPATRKTVDNVDLVLTSPPYANAQRYTRSLRLELFVLGFTSDGADERDLDKLQVGTERVPEETWSSMMDSTTSERADRVIRKVSRVDKFRAAIVGRYVRDMKTVVENCYSALRPGGHAVLVIGNNCVRGEPLDNAAILADLGAQAGFKEQLRVRNRIPSRGLLTKRHHTAGVITHEHVLVLKKPDVSA